MLKDHQIKDAILKSMAEASETTYFNSESVSKHWNISIEKAYDLLKAIYDDRKSTIFKDGYHDKTKFVASPDVNEFLKRGGYTKIERIEYWRNFPKNKWWLLDPVKFVGGAIFGWLITLGIQRLTKQEKELPLRNTPQQESKSNEDTVQKNAQQANTHAIDSISK